MLKGPKGLTAGQLFIKESCVKELGYDEAIQVSTQELEYMLEVGKPLWSILDNPIYPANSELYDQFFNKEDNYFDEKSYIKFLMLSGKKWWFDEYDNVCYTRGYKAKSSDFKTPLGKKCQEVVRKYTSCYRYYDDMMGMIYLNLDTYNNDEVLKEEVFMLLQEPCIKDSKGVDYTYAMEIKPGYDAEKDEEVEAMLIIRLVEAYY